MRCARTMASHGDHSKMVKCPSCDAHQRNRIVLIVDLLRRREMTRTAQLFRRSQRGGRAFNGLCHIHLLHLRMVFPAHDLRAKPEQFIAIGQKRYWLHRPPRQAGHTRYGTDQLLLPRPPPPRRRLLRTQSRELAEGRRHGIEGIGCTIDSRHDSTPAGTTSRVPPRPCARMDTASCTSTLTE